MGSVRLLSLAFTSALILGLAAPGVAHAADDPGSDTLQDCIDRAMQAQQTNWVCFGPPKEDPASAVNEDDSWCVGNICHYRRSDYSADSRADAAYGNQDGVTGTLTVQVHTNLNGRSAQWIISLAWTTGPAIKYVGMTLACREDRNNLPDGTCGSSGFKPSIGPTAVSWKSRVIQGEKLKNSAPYYAELSGAFDAGGSRWGMETLRTATFNCLGGDNDRCYFPDRAMESIG
jgi:hypothetical protein